MKRGHKKLDVWNEGISLAAYVYRVTDEFPKAEIYGLISQMRRAAVSIPSNVAEGAARITSKEFSHYLNIAGGSLSELDTQAEIALKVGYLSDREKQEFDLKLDSISAKLAGLIRSVKNKRREM